MFAEEGVCNLVCGAEEDEDGICEDGTERGLGAAVGYATLWVEVEKMRMTYELPG